MSPAFDIPRRRHFKNQRRQPDSDRNDAEDGGDRTFEKRRELTVCLDHRGHETVLEQAAEHQAENGRCDRKTVFLHKIGNDAQHQHDADAEDGVIDGECSYDAEHENDRHENVTRHPQQLFGGFDGQKTKRQQQQIGNEE